MSKKLKFKNVHYVYIHMDPRNSQVVYVGKGTAARAWAKCNRSAEHKRWIAELKSLNLLPIIKIAHILKDGKDALIREKILISFLLKTGHILFNKNKGGGGHPGGPTHPAFGKSKTPEQRLKMSLERKGVPRPDIAEQARQRMMGNTVRRGKKQPPEAVEKMRKALIGNQYRSVKILCINNGKVYSSVKQAWTELKLDDRSVFRVLKGEWKHTKGFQFKYID